MTEGRIMDDVMLVLNGPDIVVFRNNIGKAELHGRWVAFGVGGVGGSDLIAVFRGRAVFIEIKSASGRQTIEQQTFQRLVELKGAEYKLWRSADEARAWLVQAREGAA
jgi:hypothetical protein